MFWRNIFYNGRHGPEVLSQVFQRSKHLTIAIKVDLYVDSTHCTLTHATHQSSHQELVDISVKKTENITAALQAVSNRTVSLEITTSCAVQMDVIAPRILHTPTYSVLENLGLHLIRPCEPGGSFRIRPLPLDQHIPPLRRLTLSYIPIYRAENNSTVSTVTHLHVKFNFKCDNIASRWVDFRGLLSRALNLEYLSLDMSCNPRVIPTDTSLDLPGLKDLTIAFSENNNAARFISLLSAPNLNSIAIGGSTTGRWRHEIHPLEGFRFGLPGMPTLLDNLTSLSITWDFIGRNVIIGLFMRLNVLEILHLKNTGQHYGGTDKILAVLLHYSIKAEKKMRKNLPFMVFCPSLQTIQTQGNNGKNIRFLREARRRLNVPVQIIVS